MINEYFTALMNLAVSMGFYMMIGLMMISLVNIFLKKEFIANHLGNNSLWSIIKASLLGVPLPLCSCGVVPTGLYLKDKGASDPTVVSFLISTPQTGVDSILATYGLMGVFFAWYRPLTAFVSGIIGGIVVRLFKKEKYDGDDVKTENCGCSDCSYEANMENSNTGNKGNKKDIKKRMLDSFRYAFGDFLSDISIHFIAGLLIAALISVLIPDDLLVRWGITGGIWAMLIMIAIGMPMYICSTASIPIALSLMAKGISPGAAFVFLFMGPFTNVASLMVIFKKMGKRTTLLYVLGAVISALAFGFLLDVLAPLFSFPIINEIQSHGVENAGDLIKIVTAGIFFVFLIYNVGVKARMKFKKLKGQ